MAGGITPTKIVGGYIRYGSAIPDSILESIWKESIEFNQFNCSSSKTLINVCEGANQDPPVVQSDKVFDELCLTKFFPFHSYKGNECSTADVDWDSSADIVRNALASDTSALLATEAALGANSFSPSFASSAIPISDSAYNISTAISLLLQFRKQNGMFGKHKIHVPSEFLPDLQKSFQVSNDKYDIVVDDYPSSYVLANNIVGGGSAATIPDLAAGEAWIVVTGDYEFGVGQIKMSKVREARKNSLTVLAERMLITRFETCKIFAVKAKLGGC